MPRYALVSLFLATVLGAPTCPSGSKALAGQNYCVQFVAKNMTWVDAQKNCKSLKGQLIQLASPASAQALRKVFPGSNPAWVGIVGLPSGAMQWTNGTECTFVHLSPDLALGNGQASLDPLHEAVTKCASKLKPPKTQGFDCAYGLAVYKCFLTPLKKQTPTPKPDQLAFTQLMRMNAYAYPEIGKDKACLAKWKKAFFPKAAPKFNKEMPYVATTMDMMHGSESKYSDLYMAAATKTYPSICQIDMK
ncbi:unnamed protein product, partial [Mesorhabditis spiculigera]